MGPTAKPRTLTQLLSEEHALLRRAHAAFARYAEWIGSSADADRSLVRPFLRFFREFGDRRHHEEEERLLFTWLEAQGLSGSVGPLVVLRHEHELGRDLRQALVRAAEGLAGSPDERARFRDLALRYVELGLAHMVKEEEALFPLAERLARRAGGAPRYTNPPPTREREWVERIEARAAAWPTIDLTLREHGTREGFERLCGEALASMG